MARFVIERHSGGNPEQKRYWTGAGKKWSADLEAAIIVRTRSRANEIIEQSPRHDSGSRPYVYSVEELV